MLHNQQLELPALPELYATARALASYVVPQEYGLEPEDKVKIGSAIGSSMLHKLRRDLLTPMEQDRGTGAHADVEQVRTRQHPLPNARRCRPLQHPLCPRPSAAR